jgi:NADPH:quinone reductase-like Zn-dependent oxidoreductase
MSIPSVYNALRYTGPGGELQLTEKEVLPLPPNEVLVKVKAASINPVDIQLWRSGLVAVVSGDKGLGRDFSGTVVSVGKDVKGWTEGDDIFGLLFEAVSQRYTVLAISANRFLQLGQTTLSQYIHIDPAKTPVAKKPNCFSHEAAAAIPLVALTAYACLDWLPPAGTAQRKVVVRGASGGTGSWLVQCQFPPFSSKRIPSIFNLS